MERTSRPLPLSTRLLLAGGALLVANSAYLAADGSPHIVYFGNVVLHLVLGLALVVPFALWWRRRLPEMAAPGARRGLLLASGLLLLGAAVSGGLLVWLGNATPMRPLLWTHVTLAVLGLAGLLLAFARAPRPRLWRLAAVGLAAAVVLPAVALLVQRWRAERAVVFENPPATLTMAEESMKGEEGPFFPSSVHTSNRGVVKSSIYLEPQSCGRSGCHPDLVEQWEASAHHFSSFNNQWYRASIEYMQEVAGVTASKWCGGCHDPAVLQSGMMDTPIQQIIDTPEAQAGLTCTACHMISEVRSSMGQGDYEIEVPALHDLATSKSKTLNAVHDLLVRVDPEPHRRTFIKPFFRGTFSPEFCSSCHKVHLDVPVNNYRWIRGFNEYDNWQASGVSGYGARSFYYPPKSQNCIDCHMPQVESDDAANKDGLIRSHRFAAANTALPVANRDEVQLRHVIDFLQARQVTIDIFAMSEAKEGAVEGAGLTTEGPALATTFAVGEESAMAVGTGGAALGPAETIYAPIDRIPAAVRRGESTRIDVVLRTRGVGHFFPGGTVDAYDCWAELKAVDDQGRVLFWSGMADEESPVEEGAHFYRSLMIDAHGNPINKRNAFANRALVYVRLIPPGAADTVHFRLNVPPDAGDTITLTAKLNYRKFSWYNTHFSFAGVPAPGEATFTKDFDDRTFVFTGDTSKVSGKVKGVPKLPIVVMSEDTATLKVLDPGEPLPDMARAELKDGDRERWNDYGIGLLLQGDLRAAKHAFTRVTEVEPGYVDGWVNLGRVAVAEGDLEEARRVLEKALSMQPELARAHFFLATVEKEEGDYDKALEHFRTAERQFPKDRVVVNQIGRVMFLKRDFRAAVEETRKVLAIDPEDLMAHYTLMLAYRGLGDKERAGYHQKLYERFKVDEPSQVLTGKYREEHPHDNNERQSIHEHYSVPLEEANRLPVASAETAGGG